MLAPFARRTTTIEVAPPFNERDYVSLTLAMMQAFGIRIRGSLPAARWTIPPRQAFRAGRIRIAADLSSAAFLLGLAALHPADLTLTGAEPVGSHPEGRILGILERMGVPLRFDARRGTIRVRHGRPLVLKPVVADMRSIPDFIPMLSVLAAAAAGRSVLRNVAHGRLKESDRVDAMLQVRHMGVRMEERENELIFDGGRPLNGASLSSFNDHRVEMALAVAGTVARGRTEITFPNAFRTSYPDFLDHVRALGGRMEIR